ncbi:MAG: ChbG/HpnK family deacetylase, partial [Acidobacteriota bacterium]
EIDAELRAQIRLAQKKGVNVQYLDTHYLTASNDTYPGLGDLIRKIAADFDLPLSGTFGEREFGIYETPVSQKLSEAVEGVREMSPGLWLWVCHPAIDSPEQRALIHSRPEHIQEGGGVGVHRAKVLDVLRSIEVRSMILKKRIRLTDYTEIWATEKQK